jgi:hypothetical protein
MTDQAMSDPMGSTPSVESLPTRKPLPVPSPVDDPVPLQPLDQSTDGGWTCPHCSAVLEASASFCEVCGYDPSTGSLPHTQAPVAQPEDQPATASPASSSTEAAAETGQPATPAVVPGGFLVAVITADADYYDSNQVEEVLFPVAVPARTIELPNSPVSIGRRSRSRGTNPSLDLAGPPEDPAVSHIHASLVPNDDGTWSVVDHGSTNGTYLNESADPIPANRPLPVTPGDRIHLGLWTRITLELRQRT